VHVDTGEHVNAFVRGAHVSLCPSLEPEVMTPGERRTLRA
jgi:hypothetical protein